LGNNIGVICTADGTFLGDTGIEKGLAAWEKLPAEARKPGAVEVEPHGSFDPTKSVLPPPGVLVVREFCRQLEKNGSDQLCAPRKRRDFEAGDKVYEILDEPNRDFMWLTEAEWKGLVPPNPKEGDTFFLPVPIRNRLLRFHLVDAAKGLGQGWERDHIRKGDLTLTVTSVTAEKISLQLEGAVLLMDKPEEAKAGQVLDAHLGGQLEYDRKAKAWTRFDIVGLGSFRGMRGICQGLPTATPVKATLGFVFELAPKEAVALAVPPRGTRLQNESSSSKAAYFDGAVGKIQPDTAK
jgi:hypothetical protein